MVSKPKLHIQFKQQSNCSYRTNHNNYRRHKVQSNNWAKLLALRCNRIKLWGEYNIFKFRCPYFRHSISAK